MLLIKLRCLTEIGCLTQFKVSDEAKISDTAKVQSRLEQDNQHEHVREKLSSIHKTGCYQRLEGEEGYLDSPNYPAEYPQGLECCYEIARPSSRYCGLMLYAHLFQVLKTVEDGDFCLTDWFVMDSCVPEGGSRLCGNLTGSTFQYLFQPGSRAIRFIFHSSKSKCDRTLEYRYQLKYHLLKDCDGLFQEAVHTDIPGETSTPCYTRIADRSGTINTPYHPSVYPSNVDCVYEFVR
uniref:CUB domain-containing protein n=1 Tax=Timema cristinae TaxID=61476 RepID=A0A7R9D5M5_TIMCR|nr:unnamed protein product [Timema cristinae]